MREPAPFDRIAILGTGLIGASFGFAVQNVFPDVSITAFDRDSVLEHVAGRGLHWKVTKDARAAVSGAELIYIALPVGVAIDLMAQISVSCDSGALVTDAGSTKTAVCRAASMQFKGGAQFLGGHPVAGKELSGFEHATAELFRGTRYVLIGNEDEVNDRARKFQELVRAIGAEPVWCDAETHDWALAVVSQMPQLAAVALARVIADETDETGLPLSLAGRGLRDLLRIAGSPYEVWQDICLTNTENIARTLDRLAQAIEFLRSHLADKDLLDEFRASNEVYKSLHGTGTGRE
ncbi:MAG TPA: prephenate dehydrogenase [Candidatus Acidoferrales bacterium]|nr:prephenate dehydrogenase [Candidatus Acidoferrales bacterium]